ncbi:MAG: helix-turn-helix domain-containing protein [Clostridia bacterium]|nr:helix-turn-helix transcriptional regulator [Clostridium sp.]MBS6252895.1 helix-turn-helix transcriptional regulator [Clostridium sp.]
MDSNERYLRKNIGKKIKLARAKTNFTQEKLAEELSLSTRYISQLERGIAFGSATTIVNLCKALNISSDFLFDDLIGVDASCFDDFVDDRFLEAYMKLNDYNKSIVSALTNQLIKLQNDNKKSSKAI